MRILIHTLGCKLNQSESEALASQFAGQGFFIVSSGEKPDLIIVNTCTVTSKSAQKSRRIIRKLSAENPQALVIITGCYAQIDSEYLSGLIPNGFVLPHDNKDILLDLPLKMESKNSGEVKEILTELLRARKDQENMPKNTRFRYRIKDLRFHSRAFVKIQDGCNNACSYCIVPFTRGPSISMKAEEIISDAVELEKRGYKEIVLTGVNITSYKEQNRRLAGLLEDLIEKTDSVRFRLSSLEPDGIDESLVRIASSPRICPHFHLPVQSLSDKILDSMNRKYHSGVVYNALAMLRECKTDPFLAGDFILGFPGETEDDFSATKEGIIEAGFSQLHVFQFSPRPGTRAVKFREKIPERIAKERSGELIQISQDLYKRYAENWIGRTLYALVEKIGESGEGECGGTTENYLHVKFEKGSISSLHKGMLCGGTIQKVLSDHCIFQAEDCN